MEVACHIPINLHWVVGAAVRLPRAMISVSIPHRGEKVSTWNFVAHRVSEQWQTAQWPLDSKTFIHTPALESLFLDRIAATNVSNVDVAIVEAGNPWGARGILGNSSLPMLTTEDEIRYFVHWVHKVAFPNSIVRL